MRPQLLRSGLPLALPACGAAPAGAVTAWRNRAGGERAGVLDAFMRDERAAQ